MSNNDDVLILTERDLCHRDKKTCNGSTLKGKPCKNKVFGEYNYCKLHYQKFKLEKPQECPVCMENLDNVKTPLSCSHWVHRQCILQWGKDQCPVCRSDIKLTSKERKKLRKKSSHSEDIVLPPQILELLEAIVRSFPYSMRDGFMFDIDIDGDTIMLINDHEEDEMFSSTEFT